MKDRRSALMWAIAWWFARRWIRRRTTTAVAGLAAGATARRSRIGAVVAAVVLVAAIAGAFVAWRRLAGQPEDPWLSSDGDGSAVPLAPESPAPEAPAATA